MADTQHNSNGSKPGSEPGPKPETATAHADVANDRDAIMAIQQQVVDAAESVGFRTTACFAVRLALEEAIVNAFKHGHRNVDPAATVHVEYEVDQGMVKIAVQDQGPGFDPGRVPDPTLDENLELPSGRGLMLMRAYMTEVRHNETGNRVEMVLHDAPDEDDDDVFVD
ncbi:MAG: ATP-binding protein [Planctomycetota bacterium]